MRRIRYKDSDTEFILSHDYDSTESIELDQLILLLENSTKLYESQKERIKEIIVNFDNFEQCISYWYEQRPLIHFVNKFNLATYLTFDFNQPKYDFTRRDRNFNPNLKIQSGLFNLDIMYNACPVKVDDLFPFLPLIPTCIYKGKKIKWDNLYYIKPDTAFLIPVTSLIKPTQFEGWIEEYTMEVDVNNNNIKIKLITDKNLYASQYRSTSYSATISLTDLKINITELGSHRYSSR